MVLKYCEDAAEAVVLNIKERFILLDQQRLSYGELLLIISSEDDFSAFQ